MLSLLGESTIPEPSRARLVGSSLATAGIAFLIVTFVVFPLLRGVANRRSRTR